MFKWLVLTLMWLAKLAGERRRAGASQTGFQAPSARGIEGSTVSRISGRKVEITPLAHFLLF